MLSILFPLRLELDNLLLMVLQVRNEGIKSGGVFDSVDIRYPVLPPTEGVEEFLELVFVLIAVWNAFHKHSASPLVIHVANPVVSSSNEAPHGLPDEVLYHNAYIPRHKWRDVLVEPAIYGDIPIGEVAQAIFPRLMAAKGEVEGSSDAKDGEASNHQDLHCHMRELQDHSCIKPSRLCNFVDCDTKRGIYPLHATSLTNLPYLFVEG
mmetsp:Transcript_33808/g.77173  ORF Transcript_33808/g.77173 Transcript_33808/m.77173 type:complete len:208 (+) Transcript_33808:1463-2086(+)